MSRLSLFKVDTNKSMRRGRDRLGTRSEKWIGSLVAGLDKHADKETREKILERCGRDCQSLVLIKKAQAAYENSKNTEEFLDKLSKIVKHLHRDKGNVYMIYERCFCPQVSKIPRGSISATYCNCSRGWTKALFEGALGRPVDVLMEQSIITGDKQCKFKVIL